MINEQNKHSWCVNAFHGMSGNNDGSTKMCCMISDEYSRMAVKDPGIRTNAPVKLYLGESSIKDNFDNFYAKQIRTNLENGIRDNACSKCWQEEDGGRKSKRMRDNEKYIHRLTYEEPFTGLAIFELNLGNTCNIKCRTCHPTISSQWMKEEYDLHHINFQSFKDYSNSMKKYHQTYDEESPFWKDLESNLHTIKQFDFYGGEPFLSKKMWEILRICVDKGYAKDIELHYNTNGTIWPKEADLFKNFKSVNLSFSIDGIGEQFEYMRHGAKWNEVVENMKKASEYRKEFPKLEICWCITLSTLNIYYLPETLDEFYKSYTDFGLYLNLVHGPAHFNISHMHPEVKTLVIDRLEKINKDYVNAWYNYLPGIIGFMKNGDYKADLWKTFKFIVEKHDRYRQEDFNITFKEFADIVRTAV